MQKKPEKFKALNNISLVFLFPVFDGLQFSWVIIVTHGLAFHFHPIVR